jgi:hypothetical protein
VPEEITFKLNKSTTVEFALFERFARFLTKIEYASNPDRVKKSLAEHKHIKKKSPPFQDDFYAYVAELLQFITPQYVQKIFSDTDDEAIISIERFKFFCDEFIRIFLGLDEDTRKHYKAIQDAFLPWRNDIYITHKWSLPDENKETNLLDEKKEKSEISVADIPEFIFTVDTKDRFLTPIKPLYDYYNKFGKKFQDESARFENLRVMFENRWDRSEPYRFENYLRKNFYDGIWGLYELNGNSILESTITFGQNGNNEETSVGFQSHNFYCTKDDTNSAALCEFDIFNKSIYIIKDRAGGHNLKIFECFYFSLEKPNAENYIGHKLIYEPKSASVKVKLTVLKKISLSRVETKRLFFKEHNIYDRSIPDYIRSVFLCPEEIGITYNPFLNLDISFHKIKRMVEDQNY